MLKIVASRLSIYWETEQLHPEEQCGFRPARSTIDTPFVARRLKELGRQSKVPPYVCFIDLQKAYDSVDRELSWEALTLPGVRTKMLRIIRNFLDGMRARVRTNDGAHSEWFDGTQGLRQGCFLSRLLLLNVFFAAALHAVLVRFSQEAIVRDFVPLSDAREFRTENQ